MKRIKAKNKKEVYVHEHWLMTERVARARTEYDNGVIPKRLYLELKQDCYDDFNKKVISLGLSPKSGERLDRKFYYPKGYGLTWEYEIR